MALLELPAGGRRTWRERHLKLAHVLHAPREGQAHVGGQVQLRQVCSGSDEWFGAVRHAATAGPPAGALPRATRPAPMRSARARHMPATARAPFCSLISSAFRRPVGDDTRGLDTGLPPIRQSMILIIRPSSGAFSPPFRRRRT